MAELKTKKNKASVVKFITSIEDTQKRKDCKTLLKIFKDATGYKSMMWGASIVGYGTYHYKSERSTQEGDWPLTGFSPRKANISLYIMPGFKNYKDLLAKLGKHKVSKGSCLYIRKLEDVDLKILAKLIKKAASDMKKSHGVS